MLRSLKTIARKSLRPLFRALGPERVARLAWEQSVESPSGSSAVDLPALEAMAKASWQRLLVERFLSDEVGREYGVGRRAKQELVERFQTNTREIPSGTSWLFHLILARALLMQPRAMAGDVMECGCWKGASSASLSLVCALAGRRLIVCDSFQGVPEEPAGTLHQYPHIEAYGYYEKGMYAARLEEVQGNISAQGDLSVCEFVPGFFADSLPGRSDRLSFAFLDVDLASSLKDCIRHVWPCLAEGGFVFTDDSSDIEVVRVWFDEDWWRRELDLRPPGYVGSGCGLPIDLAASSLGYVRKVTDPASAYGRVEWLRYPASDSAT